MNFDLNGLVQIISQYLWPSIRISGFVLTLPVISSYLLPSRVKLVFLLALCLIVAPLHPEWPSLLNFSSINLLQIAKEFFLGLMMGFTMQIIFQAFIVGGHVIAMQAGLGYAILVDPASKASVPLIAQFYLMLVTLVFLLIDGHLIMIKYVVDSFNIQPIGGITVGKDALWQLIFFTGWMFKGAIMLALPAIVSLLVVNLSFGIMMKAAPQINIFSVGFPLTIILGVIIVYVTTSSVLPHIKNLLNIGINTAQELIQ